MKLRFFLLIVVSLAACGSSPKYIANTKVEDTENNQKVLERVEAYRVALENRDASKLLMMASEKYWDDGGTPSGEDDYGYTDLKEVLSTRLNRASDIRYSLRYKKIRYNEDKAFVDVLIDASFTVMDADGQKARKDMRDRNQFVLVFEDEDWKFLSGM